ncbi:alpha/beta hydrolase family protein [Lichenicoccus sp.]|uniref:alpha/beta hydrolase family protein n=1 Tax=Lichenicoccus sp. TaxID=2781899 RepID=UPI003D12BC3D
MATRSCLLLAVLAMSPAPATAARPAGSPLHQFGEIALSPDGARLASLEADLPVNESQDVAISVLIRRVAGGHSPVLVRLPCAGPDCIPSSLAWAPDGQRLAFVLQPPHGGARAVYAVQANGTGLTRLLSFKGTLQDLRYGPGGALAVLATANAHKEPGATQAAARLAGEIGASEDEQRIATITGGSLHWQSPASLYVYQYDWRPDPQSPSALRFVATAAPGNGDNNWWTARLYEFGDAQPRLLYAPPQRQQLADPVVAPDGSRVAFIGGIMSDFGSTGGDAFELALDHPAQPDNLTPGLAATITSLSWSCGPMSGARGLTAGALAGAATQMLGLNAHTAPQILWSGEADLSRSLYTSGLSCSGGTSAAIRQTFTEPPELQAGPVGQWRSLTHENAGRSAPARVRSIVWKSDRFDVQGWLLSPRDAPDDGPKGPMIVNVHGGPSAAWTPYYLTPRGDALFLLRAGYRVFLPNPRGSFGQSEAFAQANVRDFGHGDLRDIMAGIDAVERAAPVDDARLGLTGYSYGGYMTMWTVTQTNRFKAAVAGAGVSDWLSYYGENGIDEWMLPFFGASVYADPAIYARSSPIAFITQVRTPTLEYAGDADIECPLPQTQEFYHALHTLGVPTQFVVYAGQGHGMKDPASSADANRRTLAWFDRYLKPAGPGGQ